MLCSYYGQATKGPFVPLFLQHRNSSFLHTSLSLFSISFIFCSLYHGLWLCPMVASLLLFLFSCMWRRSFRISSLGWGCCTCYKAGAHICVICPLYHFQSKLSGIVCGVWVYSKICNSLDNKFLMLIPYKPTIRLRIKSVSPAQWQGKGYYIKGYV